MPTLSGKLTEKHNELVAKKEAARKEAEKLEKKKRDNARKKRSREVCVKKGSVIFITYSTCTVFAIVWLKGSV